MCVSVGVPGRGCWRAQAWVLGAVLGRRCPGGGSRAPRRTKRDLPGFSPRSQPAGGAGPGLPGAGASGAGSGGAGPGSPAPQPSPDGAQGPRVPFLGLLLAGSGLRGGGLFSTCVLPRELPSAPPPAICNGGRILPARLFWCNQCCGASTGARTCSSKVGGTFGSSWGNGETLFWGLNPCPLPKGSLPGPGPGPG